MFMQSNYVRLLSGRDYGWGVVGLAVVSMLVVIGGFALHEALWRRIGPSCSAIPPLLIEVDGYAAFLGPSCAPLLSGAPLSGTLAS